ncbi:cholecystokinin receptor [Elysia marginata]|uniref:Cholecystokinin receptor n=1 Tax=Elysia marginata TaxID=1093978 RepID=A0AAV4FP39_9GAST|nr:cholecystokinin receptor [Elysia marginata]
MFTALGSIFTLLFIAIDRYRKVCLPFERQLHMHHMKVFVVPVIMGGALFFAWPSLLVYGLRSAETGYPGLRGRDCSASESLRGTLVPLVYNSVLFGGFIVIVVALACLYFKVLRGVHRLNKNKMMRRKRRAVGQDSTASSTSILRRGRDVRKYDSREKELKEDKNTDSIVNNTSTEAQVCALNLNNDAGKEDKTEENLENCKTICNCISAYKGLGKSVLNGNIKKSTMHVCDANNSYRKNCLISNRFQQADSRLAPVEQSPSYEEVPSQDWSFVNDCSQCIEQPADEPSEYRLYRSPSANQADLSHKDSRHAKHDRKPFRRRLSFPLTRTYERFSEKDCANFPGPSEKIDTIPLIKIIRKNLYSSAQITDSCSILQPRSPQDAISMKRKPTHVNKGCSILRVFKNYQGISGRRRTCSEIVRGEVISMEDLNVDKSCINRKDFNADQGLKNLKLSSQHLDTTTTQSRCESKNGKSSRFCGPEAHSNSLRELVSDTYDSECFSKIEPYLQEPDKKNNLFQPQSKDEHEFSTLKRNKMLRFSIDPKNEPSAPEYSLCPQKETVHGVLKTTLTNEKKESDISSLKTCTCNTYREKSREGHTQSANSNDSELVHSDICSKSINNSNHPTYATKRTKVLRPLTLSQAGRRLKSMCPPSSVIEATSATPHTKQAMAIEAAASSSSFAVSAASTCTLDSRYSRVSYLPPDDMERSTSSSATLSTHSRHRHNDSRKLRGHRGHLPRSRTTTIALLVTLIFVASFLPHLCLQAAQLINERFATNLNGSASLVYNTFLRSYFINSVANPVLYGILNVKFSGEVRALMGRV